MNGTFEAASPALAIVQAAWNAGARHWNADALAAVYTADALFFGGRPGQSVGTGAIREYFASYEGVIDSATLELVEQQIVRLGTQCFLAQGYGEFSFTLSGGRMSRSRLRTTLVIALQDGEWRIRQHHFSAEPESPPI
ncbi:SgcJ/EcaC family oxidoreductase [Paraburkholderia dipogonis]|uniref:SgcJ/EcaC family oxidoreductase n=1 Tax=Paraburkholderia dipogonis TaxID=1211383 RepID=A0A4Y8NBC3_9BURK|nr:SgcJ/EcaC family oxidoreductase [Paraburkholderia dipogonis]TFE46985.1 SgcJ/EcaC family oxidoreductase [Paraburkholderia dipogonis]